MLKYHEYAVTKSSVSVKNEIYLQHLLSNLSVSCTQSYQSALEIQTAVDLT